MAADGDTIRASLHFYLQRQREALLFKLEGLSEKQMRWPATPTGTNLLGLIKHLTWVELGYFGECMGRPTREPWPWETVETTAMETWEKELVDQWARADESPAHLIDGYQQAWAHSDTAILALPLDTTGSVPWWPEERKSPTLAALVVHVTAETARHAGHADIIREGLDGVIGMGAATSNLPPEMTPQRWRAHRERLRRIAEQT